MSFSLQLHLEQPPSRPNRVRLSTRTDRLGVPRLRAEWQWSAEDRARHRRLRQVLAREFDRAGLGQITALDEGDPDPNAHHHAGTTRMHHDPAGGAVDPDGRVHCLENLYVAGSSAFPTAGFANPTLTVIALAVRLAERLQSR